MCCLSCLSYRDWDDKTPHFDYVLVSLDFVTFCTYRLEAFASVNRFKTVVSYSDGSLYHDMLL